MTTTLLRRTAVPTPERPAPLGAWLLAWLGSAHANPARRRRRHQRLIASWASALCLGTGWPVWAQTPTSAPPAADVAAHESMPDRFAEAMLAYERNHWPQAFAALVALATEGHADAARVAMLMHRHGPRLYGQHFVLTASQWALLASSQPPTRGEGLDPR